MMISANYCGGVQHSAAPRYKCVPGVNCNKGPVVVRVLLSLVEHSSVTTGSPSLSVLSQGTLCQQRRECYQTGLSASFFPLRSSDAQGVFSPCAAVSRAFGYVIQKRSYFATDDGYFV